MKYRYLVTFTSHCAFGTNDKTLAERAMYSRGFLAAYDLLTGQKIVTSGAVISPTVAHSLEPIVLEADLIDVATAEMA